MQIRGGTEPRFFSSGKKKTTKKARNVNSLGIIFDFHGFYFLQTGKIRKTRRRTAPPRKKAEGLRSAAPAAVGSGDKRNLSLSFRRVRFQKTFSRSKLEGRFFWFLGG